MTQIVVVMTGGVPTSVDLEAELAAKAEGTGTASGTNTGDDAVNALYSGLAASKQDTLVSGTNIKTVNSTSLLGSGDVVISGSGISIGQDLALSQGLAIN